jgi:hypothetical protein
MTAAFLSNLLVPAYEERKLHLSTITIEKQTIFFIRPAISDEANSLEIRQPASQASLIGLTQSHLCLNLVIPMVSVTPHR